MTRGRHPFWRGLIPIVALLASIPLGQAVTDEEIYRDFRFNFINPGARSLGLGGAFIAIADDATAAQANPGGLTTLSRPQLFTEIRSTSVDPTVTETGQIFPFSDPSNPDGFDVTIVTTPSDVTSPTFLSYVYPINDFRLAISRQELLNSSNRTATEMEFLFGAAGSDIRRSVGEIDLQLVNWNLSFAYRVSDRLSLGASLSYGTLDVTSRLVNTYEDPTGQLIGDPTLAGVPFELFSTESNDSDSDLTWTAGLLWSISGKVRLGGVYRQGGDFSVQQDLEAQSIDRSLVPGRISSRVFFNESGRLLTPEDEGLSFTNQFRVPDSWGLGLAWNPISRLTLSADAVRIQWTDLLAGFNSRLNLLTVGWETEEAASFTVDDQTNLHLGAEVLISDKPERRWVVRAGVHQDRDHRIRADFPEGETGFGLANNENFPAGDDQNHVSIGFGFVLRKLQLDAAADFSESTTEAVVSLTFEF